MPAGSGVLAMRRKSLTVSRASCSPLGKPIPDLFEEHMGNLVGVVAAH